MMNMVDYMEWVTPQDQTIQHLHQITITKMEFLCVEQIMIWLTQNGGIIGDCLQKKNLKN